VKHILVNAKGWAALVSLVASALLAQYGPDGKVGTALTVVVIVAGAIGTWAVPNADARAWEE